MEKETYKPVAGYEGKYSVSNLGNVYSHLTERVLRPCKEGCGYLTVVLYDNGKKWQVGVHRLVARAFVPNPENKPTVNHLNENKEDNRASNLGWATMKEQCNYGTRTARQVAHTNYKEIAKKIDYKALAQKRDHTKSIEATSRKTRLIKDGVVIGDFPSRASVARYLGIGSTRISDCIRTGELALGKYEIIPVN